MGRIIALIGAGGKTTAMKVLAHSLAGQHVLMTTTTHIRPEAPPVSRTLLLDPGREDLLNALSAAGIVCAGIPVDVHRLGGLEPELFREAVQASDWTVCEADGAHMRPLKLHRPGEPVIPEGTGEILVVEGLSAMGKPVCEVIHRYDRNPDWAGDREKPAGPEEIAACTEDAVRACGSTDARIRVFLNQADAVGQEEAEKALEHIQGLGFSCKAGSLLQDPASFLSWFWA